VGQHYRDAFSTLRAQRCVQARRISMSFLGSDTTIEVKRRATGFAQLYDWLNDRDVLIVKADWQEPLVVLRISLAAEIAGANRPGHTT
jgi:hypothetical protein